MCSNTFSLIGQYNKKTPTIPRWGTKSFCYNDVTMFVGIHGYNKKSFENRDLYVSICTKELYKDIFLYNSSMLWNDLTDILKESSSFDVFESNYRFIIGWQISEYICVYLSVNLHFWNPLHISAMSLNLTEAPMYILNHDVCTLLSGFCTKGFLYHVLG